MRRTGPLPQSELKSDWAFFPVPASWRLAALLGCGLAGQAAAAPLSSWEALQAAPQTSGVQEKQRDYLQAQLELGERPDLNLQAVADANAARGADAQLSHDLAAGVSLRFGGPQALQRDQQKRQQALAEAELAWQLAQLSALENLLDAWYDLADAEQQATEAEQQLHLAELEYRRVQAQAQSGVANELELGRASLARAQAQQASRTAGLNRTQAQSALLALGVLTEDPSADRARWAPLPLPHSEQDSAPVRQAALAMTAAQQRLGELRAQQGPQLQAQGNLNAGHFNLSGTLDRELSGSAAAKGTLRDTGAPSWSLGLSASLPLGGSLPRQVAQAEQAVQRAQQAAAQAQAREAQTRRLWAARSEDARRNLALAGELLTEARQNEAVTAQRLAQGLVPQATLAQAHLGTLKAEGQVWAARRQLDRTALQGWRALGGIPDLSAPPAPAEAPLHPGGQP